MARLEIPTDASYNAAVGKVALAHGHLETFPPEAWPKSGLSPVNRVVAVASPNAPQAHATVEGPPGHPRAFRTGRDGWR